MTRLSYKNGKIFYGSVMLARSQSGKLYIMNHNTKNFISEYDDTDDITIQRFLELIPYPPKIGYVRYYMDGLKYNKTQPTNDYGWEGFEEMYWTMVDSGLYRDVNGTLISNYPTEIDKNFQTDFSNDIILDYQNDNATDE